MEKRLLDVGRQWLKQVLDGATGFELVSDRVDVPLAERGRADAIWVLRSGDEEWRLLVELKTTLWPRDVEGLAAQARTLAADAKADRCLVVAPRLTERTRELLQRQGMDYIDLRGDLRVMVPGRLLLVAHGVAGPTIDELPDRKDRIANPFKGKASRIVRALLANPRQWFRVTELAETVKVSAGLCVKTLRTLETDLHVRRDRHRRVRLADGEALLRRWAAVSSNAFRNAGRFASPILDPDELAMRLSERLGRLGMEYALTRLSAARFIEPYAPARVVDVYLDDESGDSPRDLNLFPVHRGESVRLVRPSDAGVFQFTEERQGVTVVNPVQLFVDLSSGRGRESDVAERLVENRLRHAFTEEGER